MKLAVYLTLLFAAVIMMATAAPHNKSCHRLKDAHANAVCKAYCGKAGYKLGECGVQGICICKKTKISTKVSKSSK
ncbi:hypothetical protein G6F62_001559 [Rhizopus arrhizus]|nr:hypothetical protein G6F33_000660 [Rhizopus arrhizus]KAG0950385.1 hypothetical protein G6F32_005203 [Rhizopus arrhizus]KAG1295042.1 hypothetical protein G6F66_004683 [Rhizopus arrhizus]KAG1357493.1 hypothetical protein G6F62_001559 [Rhizopus arrhizus]KAG1379863.1 hypothetical protein G6F61_004567 [Rhizopus arrhizus]